MDINLDICIILSQICEDFNKKEYHARDINSIIPKLSFVVYNLAVSGKEIIKIVDILIELKKLNRLVTINDETMDLVNYIYYEQVITAHENILSFDDIMRFILLPSQKNIEKRINEGYEYQTKLEFFIALLGTFFDTDHGTKRIEVLYKYNKELCNLILARENCNDLVEIEDTLIVSTIIRLCGLFYFNLEKYEYNYQLLIDTVAEIIDNYQDFIYYCEKEGIKDMPDTEEDFDTIYIGLVKLLDNKNEKKKKL